jgi:hypothetical protein
LDIPPTLAEGVRGGWPGLVFLDPFAKRVDQPQQQWPIAFLKADDRQQQVAPWDLLGPTSYAGIGLARSDLAQLRHDVGVEQKHQDRSTARAHCYGRKRFMLLGTGGMVLAAVLCTLVPGAKPLIPVRGPEKKPWLVTE